MVTHQGAHEPRPSRGIRGWLTDRLARYMSEPVSHYDLRGRNDFDQLRSMIRKGDVLLVDGDQRVSAVIKYLTRSSWSHAVLYIGDELLRRDGDIKRRARETFGDAAEHLIVEALFDGVVASPLEKYITTTSVSAGPTDSDPITSRSFSTTPWRRSVGVTICATSSTSRST